MRRRQAVEGMGFDGLPKQAGRDHARRGLPAKKTLKVATVPTSTLISAGAHLAPPNSPSSPHYPPHISNLPHAGIYIAWG
eukprot:COSAG01_NODE_2419_length_7731_cov_34.853138_10_plen_80_part_00